MNPIKKIAKIMLLELFKGVYKVKRNYLENNYDKEKATKESLKWGMAQVKKGISKYFTWEDAENSLLEMSEITTVLVDKCARKQAKDSLELK